MFWLDRPDGAVEPRCSKAIVTLLVGEAFVRVWKIMCQAGWEAYALRHGYDLIVLACLPDNSERGRGRSPAWQKLLILNQPWSAAYERIVWLDADIVISPSAPDVVAQVTDPALVGASISGGQLSEADRHIYIERTYGMSLRPSGALKVWGHMQENAYAPYGIDGAGIEMLNTGVLVLSPIHHNDMLLEAYSIDCDDRLYEQPIISSELWRREILKVLSPRFNWEVFERRFLDYPEIYRMDDPDMPLVVRHFRSEFSKAYFMHFAGCMPFLTHLADLTEQQGDVLGRGLPTYEGGPTVSIAAG